jgi:hypothetical protein
MNPDVQLMCGVPETLRLCTAEGTLSDEDSNSFPITSPFNLFKVRTNNMTKKQG